MSQLTPSLDAALSTDRPLVFGALKLDLPGGSACFLDGGGEVSFGGSTFRGTDATFGTIAGLDTIDDGVSFARGATIMP